MELSPLTAISPVDGRYRNATARLSAYFSEGALIRYRIHVEVEYFIALCDAGLPQLQKVTGAQKKALRRIVTDFDAAGAGRVKEIESRTNHDVKAVEYFLKEAFDRLGLSEFMEFIHFALTSQDINNTALPLTMKAAWCEVLGPAFDRVEKTLSDLSREWHKVPMLARTHGQPASPTWLGKEIYVFVDRLKGQRRLLNAVPFSAKFGGATGNFNAHHAAFPHVDWPAFADRFVGGCLGLLRSRVTTQIEPYDNLAAFCDGLKRLNTILLDLSRDMWSYISMGYFRQRIRKGEVGSSTMPHKVNPIDFENAEGNLGMANALLEHLSAKLPISRLQRDLTDSTVTRNIGVPFAHTLIALHSLGRGLGKLLLDADTLAADLEANWAVITEGIQTILRREGYPEPYEALKALSRTNERLEREDIHAFVDTLAVSDTVREELKSLSPHSYTGLCVMGENDGSALPQGDAA